MEASDPLKRYKVGSVPTVYYIPDFISDTDQTQLLNKIYTAPVSKWKSLKNRRLQDWVPSWLTKITEKISEESSLFPSAINHVLINEYLPNQGIMPHQDGPAYYPVVAILSLGSPVVMDFTPHAKLVGTASNIEDTGSIEGTDDEMLPNHHPFSIALMPRSLLIFKDLAYSEYLHGIKDCEIQPYDTAVNATEVSRQQNVIEEHDGDLKAIHRSITRVSLTCRVVSKVHKNLFRF
ncbi:Oxoglutarate/iron-dependent dioxygenase [Artemisia annua]|uniref:Oxoglutarate/iron-dependent dioxygenase n=1 Tax=Artemisia annua TaxID=35608 RepID=A0A2U1NFU8_ARTAN|nr:Oxoglutarate/iron-dependent dioxygenase [Artemisia annua]